MDPTLKRIVNAVRAATRAVEATPRAQDAPSQWSGHRLPPDYAELMRSLGGFRMMDGSFQLYGCRDGSSIVRDVRRWNSDAEWRQEYGEMAGDLYFFAGDAFGNQFAFDFGSPAAAAQVVLFRCEGGTTEQAFSSALDLLGAVVSRSADIDRLLDIDLLAEAARAGLRPRYDEDLSFALPLIVGGEATRDNLEVLNAVAHLHLLGQLSVQAAGLPAGTRIAGFEDGS